MGRATVALCCIMKNERENLDRFLASVDGCFDEIHFTDTGSTDGSVEHLKTKHQNVIVHHFDWVHDFGKAREYSMSHTKCDYIMWLDLDDVLVNKDAFIKFRDEVMSTNHYWTATYNYTLGKNGEVLCTFIRERVVRRGHGFKWSSFLHEGLVQGENLPFWRQHVTTWWVNHLRTPDDFNKDKGRNLGIFAKHLREGNMSARMQYYYGKELFENGQHKEAGHHLMEAIKSGQLEMHDLIAALQYAALSALNCQAWQQAIELSQEGLKVIPSRAEFHTFIGDVYFNTRQFANAIPYYQAARHCRAETMGGTIFVTYEAYFNHPTEQLALCYHNLGEFDKALEEAEKLREVEPERFLRLYQDIKRAQDENKIHPGKRAVKDIVLIACPYAMPEWDSDIYQEKGLGGSETAAVEVTNWLREITGRSVKVFNIRQMSSVCESGVEYYPLPFATKYFRQNRPQVVLNWRHAIKLSEARTFVWAHDLQTNGVNNYDSYEKMLCLSEFHRDYAYSTQGVPNEKVMLWRNGINPDHIAKAKAEKNPLNIIWPSSPDRGLDRVIEIIRRARDMSGLDFKLSVFYGFDNMRAMGYGPAADVLEGQINENKNFVTYYGCVDKHTLYQHWWSSGLWVYPANFIETFCISALEALCTQTFPIVRDVGALKYTLKDAIAGNMAKMLDPDPITEDMLDFWAKEVINAYNEKSWERVVVDPAQYSWESVAREFIERVGID